MHREKLAWVVSVVLVAVLAFQLPGSMATRDDDYAWVSTLVEVHRRVADNYVEGVDEDELRRGAINGMLGELDQYTVYVPPAQQEAFDRMLEGTFKGVGIQLDQDKETLEVEVVSPIEGSPAFRAGVQAGDVIVKVNGESIAGLKIEDVIKKIAGPLGSPVTLTVRHVTGETVDLTMTRQEIIIPTIKGFQRKRDGEWDWFVSNDPKIAYVRMTQFTEDCDEKLQAALQDLLADGMQGLILDLRFNPGGRLEEAKDVVDLFLESGTIVSTKGRSRPEEVAYAKAEGTLPRFPMAVLVNDHSASASEIVAGALKDNKRALIVGTRTYGKGSVQELIPLDGKGELKLTVAYYYLPSGRLVHKKEGATDWGVEPHVIVPADARQAELIRMHMDLRDRYARPETAPAAATQPATRPMTSPVTTTRPSMPPATEPTDPQLDAAVSTLIGHIVLQGERAVRGAAVAMATILGIESTCDETAAAVVRDGWDVRSNVVASQAALHAKYRGVVPEIASRAHIENLLPVLAVAATPASPHATGVEAEGLFAETRVPPEATQASQLQGVDAIAVAHRPGLIGSLLIGVTAAKSLAWALGKPLIGVDHVHAHLYSVVLERDVQPEMPAVGLVVSGGHTALYRVGSWLDVELIGSTIDDAVGEAYDKVAALLGLGYPGGPILDALAEQGDPAAVEFPRTLLGRDSLDFSFSGLKTAVLYHVHGVPSRGHRIDTTKPPQLSEQRLRDIAASFQAACVDVITKKLKRAVKHVKAHSVIVGGGVSANRGLRAALANFPVAVHFPPLRYCTDNAAMSAGLADVYYREGRFSPLDLDAITHSQFRDP